MFLTSVNSRMGYGIRVVSGPEIQDDATQTLELAPVNSQLAFHLDGLAHRALLPVWRSVATLSSVIAAGAPPVMVNPLVIAPP
jgi:hypothetical protein